MSRVLPVIVFILLIPPLVLSGESLVSGSISLDYGTWFKSAYPGVDIFLLAPRNSPGTYHENLSVITHPYDSVAISDWMPVLESYQAALPGSIDEFVVVNKGIGSISGTASGFIEYTGSYMGHALHWLQFHVVHNGIWYTISYAADKKDFSLWKESVQDCMLTIRFLK